MAKIGKTESDPDGIFFEEGDQEIYCDILAEQVRRAGGPAFRCGPTA